MVDKFSHFNKTLNLNLLEIQGSQIQHSFCIITHNRIYCIALILYNCLFIRKEDFQNQNMNLHSGVKFELNVKKR